MLKPPAILIISGVDPTNGAGMGRDISTVRENDGFPISVPSVLTIQNSMDFSGVIPVSFDYVSDSIDVLQDEFQIYSIKTGLLPFENEWISKLTEKLQNFKVPIVIDPVFKATSSKVENLIVPDSYISFMAGDNKVITPNLKELKIIHRLLKNSEETVEIMSENISKELGCCVVTTFEAGESFIFVTGRGVTTKIPIELFEPQRNIHGTGCTFSSSLAVNLAKGIPLNESVGLSAQYTLEKVKKSVRYNKSGQYFLQ
ncbi:MAG TPA: bifunctional hydroxymethylpyrimidine kinase/phosphomethylpyrimidine kinase [bacterium]|nr:bifunctional hydroxymethylpyrimidine kinase/phosphomethylpyrimidine kinase [bacterium]